MNTTQCPCTTQSGVNRTNHKATVTPLSKQHNSIIFTLRHAGYTQTAREKLISHCEETLPNAPLNICTVGSIFINIRIQVEQVFSGHTNIVKEKLGIVDSIQTHFVSHVMNLDSWHHIEVLVSNRNQDTVNTWRENNVSIYTYSKYSKYVTSVELREERLGALYKLHTEGCGFQD